MPIPCSPPAHQVVQSAPELALLPGSDPVILGSYQWTLDHSPSLQQVVQELVRTDRKARYRFVPGLDNRYTFLVRPTAREYEIDIEVPMLAWRQCGDALEPWIASTLFLVLEVVKKEQYRTFADGNHLSFLKGSIAASFAFQRKVKDELEKADPVRLKDLPDGASIYASRFEPARWRNRQQRWLPGDAPTAAPSPIPTKTGEASVAVVDRPISLPPLPQDGAQGHAQFKAVHGQIGTAMADLNQALPALYACPEGQRPLPPTLSISPEGMVEATTLLEVIQGQEYTRLERAYLDTWKGWQAALVEGGIARPQQGAASTPVPVSKAFQDAKARAQRILSERSWRIGGPGNRLDPDITRQEQQAGQASKLDAGYLEEMDVLESSSRGGASSATGNDGLQDLFAGYLKSENAVMASLKEQAVAGDLLGLLSVTWTPLMDHLNASAKRVLNQVPSATSSQEAALEPLRVHARLAVLERFRKALWYCDLVWSQVGSAEAPMPPLRIKPTMPVP